jgi:predicted metal-dependent hydrolase
MSRRWKHNRPGRDAFKEKVSGWAARVRVEPKQVRVQIMTRKWASCSTDGRVSFSEELLRKPETFQDYVIVHELLHLKIRNHGKLFKSLLSIYVPGWQQLVLSCCSRNMKVGDVIYKTCAELR